MKMRKIFNRLALGLACLLAVASVNVNSVNAAHETYTVTFRPGNVGRFAFSMENEEETDNAVADVKADAEAVAAVEYSDYYYTVTDNGAIKVEVPNGASVNAPTYIVPNDNYFVISDWYKDSTTAVTKNADFVVDYGRLTDGVEYTVRYVIAGTNTSIRPIYSTKGNVGDTVSITAPSVIVVSTATRYFILGTETQSIVLDEDSEKNVITFAYSLEPSPVTEEESVTVIGGGTVTNTVPGAAPAAAAPGVGAAPQAVAPAAETATETTTIEEPETALASNIGGEEDTTNIEDTTTPLASGQGQFANAPLFIALAVIVVVAAAVAFYLVKKNKDKQVVDNNSDENN